MIELLLLYTFSGTSSSSSSSSSSAVGFSAPSTDSFEASSTFFPSLAAFFTSFSFFLASSRASSMAKVSASPSSLPAFINRALIALARISNSSNSIKVFPLSFSPFSSSLGTDFSLSLSLSPLLSESTTFFTTSSSLNFILWDFFRLVAAEGSLLTTDCSSASSFPSSLSSLLLPPWSSPMSSCSLSFPASPTSSSLSSSVSLLSSISLPSNTCLILCLLIPISCSRQSALTSSTSRSARKGGSIARSFFPLITEKTCLIISSLSLI